MKNYYDQKHELNIAYARLRTLKEQKELYFQATQPGAMRLDSTGVSGGNISKDVFSNYVIKIEKINAEIEIVEREIEIIKSNLRIMESSLREMKGVIEQIFVYRYIDGLSINQICKKTHYSRPQIYRKLKVIRNITKEEKK